MLIVMKTTTAQNEGDTSLVNSTPHFRRVDSQRYDEVVAKYGNLFRGSSSKLRVRNN